MNWGTKIAVSLSCFIAFILTLGIIMMHKNREGVEKDYYEKDLLYEQEIQAQKNVKLLSGNVLFELSENKLLIQYPKEVVEYRGDVLFLRPDNDKKDKTEKMLLDENSRQSIDISALQKGMWKVQVSWEMDGKKYQSEKYDFLVR